MKENTDLQMEMIKVQKKMFKKDPEGFMEQSQVDEKNTQKADKNYKPKEDKNAVKASDFVELSEYYNILVQKYRLNMKQLQINSASFKQSANFLVDYYKSNNIIVQNKK
jgi:hypothetical protein